MKVLPFTPRPRRAAGASGTPLTAAPPAYSDAEILHLVRAISTADLELLMQWAASRLPLKAS